MWKYIKRYFPYAVLAALFMTGEVLMDLLQPTIMSQIIDDGVLGLSSGGAGDLRIVITLGIQMIVLVIAGGLCGSLNNVFVHISSQNIGNLMRKDIFANIMRLSFQQADDFSTGSLVTRVTNDVTQTQNMFSQFVRGLVRTSMMTFGSLYFVFRLNTDFGLIMLAAVPFIVGIIVFCLRKAYPRFSVLQTKLDRVNAIMQEDISGVRIIKACVREAYEKLRFGKANNELVDTQLGILILFAFMTPAMFLIMNSAMIIIIALGAAKASIETVSPGEIMAAIAYTTQLLSGILMLTMLFQTISRGIASWRRVKEVLDCAPALRDGDGEIAKSEVRGKVEFRNVTFAYPGTGRPVLRNISFTIKPGETLAILGATGCGKTSLVNLIPRFYDVSDGAVLVNDIDVRNCTQKSLREKIAVTLQKSELFSRSISENIAWGNPESDAAEINKAAVIAQACDFIEASPDGYDTIVAERGMSLSGGQKQRLSIARAVLRNAEILIFDDATSALDLTTETKLYAALREYSPNCTKIIVAQRVASVRAADRILVLENGGVAGLGSHGELIKSCSAYQDIYRSQLGEDGDIYAAG